MKICIVVHYAFPHIGGVETVCYEQAKYLRRLGHDVTVLTAKLPNSRDNEVLDGVRFRRVNALNFLYQRFGIPYPLFSPSIVMILSSEIQESDICIIHSIGFMSSILAAGICVYKRKPYIVIQHNPFTPYKSILLNCIQTLNDNFAGKFILKNATQVIAVSDFVKNYVTSIFHRKVLVLYSGVDHVKFAPCTSKTLLRDKLHLPNNVFIVLTVRRLVFKNSVDLLLDTAELYKNDRGILFLIVGDGPDRDMIVARIKDRNLSNCILVGAVQNDDLPVYYQIADLFVLPSLVEGLGIVILEAMSSELPIVTTNYGGQMEFVLKTNSGLIVEREKHAIYRAIKKFIVDEELKQMVSKQNRKIIQVEFTWEIHINGLLEIINDALEKSSVL
jgi:glycosyltransferase involved in cell wall biosynthesis